jgi:hypothetical protein
MSFTCKGTSTRVFVNLQGKVLSNETSVEVWKVQKSLGVSLGIGRMIRFESGILGSVLGVDSAGNWVRRP